ncbi:MAG: hypothetical protein K9L31_01890 [Candidatus Pacebacteria bacterium]|nr:hypothetical protein [Candidatus Paceibacterota bacterium]
MTTIEKLGSGYDSGGEAHRKAMELILSSESSRFKYFVSISSASNPGMIGGQARWSVYATNTESDLFEYLADKSANFYERDQSGVIVDLSKRKIAKQKLEHIKEEKYESELIELLEGLLIDRILGKI